MKILCQAKAKNVRIYFLCTNFNLIISFKNLKNHLPSIKLQIAVLAMRIFWKDPNKWIFLKEKNILLQK